jgi:hypothetical protein
MTTTTTTTTIITMDQKASTTTITTTTTITADAKSTVEAKASRKATEGGEHISISKDTPVNIFNRR